VDDAFTPDMVPIVEKFFHVKTRVFRSLMLHMGKISPTYDEPYIPLTEAQRSYLKAKLKMESHS
jgi:hypothetical protein